MGDLKRITEVKNFILNMKLKEKLNLVVIIITAIIMSISFIIISEYYSMTKRVVYNSYHEIHRSVNREIENRFNYYSQIIADIANNAVISDSISVVYENSEPYMVDILNRRIKKELYSNIYKQFIYPEMSKISIFIDDVNYNKDDFYIKNIKEIEHIVSEIDLDRKENIYFVKGESGQKVLHVLYKYDKSRTNNKLTMIKIDIDLQKAVNRLFKYTESSFENFILYSDKGIIYETSKSDKTDEYIDAILEEKQALGDEYNGNYNEKFDDLVFITENIVENVNTLSYVGEAIIMNDLIGLIGYVIFLIVIMVVVILVILKLLNRNITNRVNFIVNKLNNCSYNNLTNSTEIIGDDEFSYINKSINENMERLGQAIKKNLSDKLVLKEAQLNAIQTQINPHFLYNTLEVMSCLAEEQGAYEVEEMTKKLGIIFRYNSDINKKMTTLEEEVKIVKVYLDLMNIRFNNRFNLILNFESNVLQQLVPKFILQPMVENAIEHGFGDKVEDCIIEIKGYLKDKFMYIEISDNGEGIYEKDLDILNKALANSTIGSNNKSIGIYNVKERLKLFYGKETEMSIKSSRDVGTAIIFKMDIGG